MKNFVLLAFATMILGLSSCVTKKKYLQLANEKTNLEAFYLDSIGYVQRHLNVCSDTVTALRLNLAERKGENNVLLSLRQELIAQINELSLEIEAKSNQSVSSRNTTKQKLAEKERNINSLKAQLANVDATIKKYQDRISAFIGDLSMDFQGFNDKLLNITSKSDKAVLVLSANSLLFKRANSSSLSSQGKGIVQKVSNVIKKYPDLEIYVVGHTDNRPPAKSYKDNWYFSTMRAVTVVREMTQVNDVNNNQVFPVGKAEFAPIASNESSDGRAQNQRIEIVAQPLSRNLIRDVQKIVR